MATDPNPNPNPNPEPVPTPESLVPGWEALTPEQQERIREIGKGTTVKKLSDENAGWRRKLREQEDETKREMEARDKRIRDLEEQTKPSADEKAELARLRRVTAELEDRDKKREEKERVLEEKNRKNAISNALSTIVAEADLVHKDDAKELLERRVRLADDDTVELRVYEEGEEKWVKANVENLKKYKVLGLHHWPSEGGSGAGSRGGGPQPPGAGKLDWARINAGDHKYFMEHEKEIDAEADRQRRAG